MLHHFASTTSRCVLLAATCALALCACGGSDDNAGSTQPRFEPGKYAWAVGSQGTILATTDGGANWSTQQSGAPTVLTGVCFADPSHGWAVGGGDPTAGGVYSSLVLATSDGGRHWATSYTSPAFPFFAVACSDANHVWAAGNGDGAVIQATTDGGKTWTTQYSDKKLDGIADITVADSSHGWAISRSGDVLATSDGGTHWVKQAKLHGLRFDWSLDFADATHGWVVSDDPYGKPGPDGSLARVWTTSDGGASWKPTSVPAGTIAALNDVACTDASHVWTGASAFGVFRSTDGGGHWIAPADARLGATIYAIAFSDAAHGWAVGDVGSRGNIIATTDGGVHWTAQTTPSHQGLLDIACPPASGGAVE